MPKTMENSLIDKADMVRLRDRNCHSRIAACSVLQEAELRVNLIFSCKRFMALPFKLVYSDDYYLPIGEHVFPAEKYRLVRKHLLESGLAKAEDFLTPKPAQDEDILLVHTREYVQKLKT